MTSQGSHADWVRVRVAGKVNLALRSGGRGPDGYHQLATVFQAVSIHDEVLVRDAAPGHFPVTVTGEQADLVPTDDTNLAVRAARLLAQEYGDPRRHGAEIVIRKAIPVTGGMAGGSADGAASLLACSYLWDLDVAPEELAALGQRLGADVPFALAGQTALGTGRGDELVPVLSRGSYHWVLAFADFQLSTPAVFRRFDQVHPDRDPAPPPVPQELLEALASSDPVALGRHLVNDLQEPALAMQPSLRRLLAEGMAFGALGAIVSGSGPTCAFLTSSESTAVDLSVHLGGLGLCRAVRRVVGPVAGARLVS